MASNSRIKGITIEIGADVTQLTKALAGVNTELSKTDSSLRDVNKLLKFDPSSTTLLAQKMDLLGKDISAAESKLQTLKEAQRQMDENGVDKNSEQYQKLQREIVDTEQKLKSLKLQSSETQAEMMKISQVGQSMQDLGGKIEAVGQKLRVVSGVATGIAAMSVKTAADFDTSMSQVQATMGIAKDGMYDFNGELVTGSQVMGALSEKAQEMGATTKFTASESADALNYLALAGYDAEKQIEALPVVLNLAAAGNMDLAYASDLVTDSMSVLNMETKDLTKFTDEMAKTASSSNTSVAQLGEAILVAGGQASICGLSTEELNTALGVLADNGMKGSQGGTMLRNALKNLYTPTEKSAKAMEELGLITRNAQGELLPLQDVLVQLGDKLENMASGDKVSAMADIFDTRTIGAANALLKSVGFNLDDVAKELVKDADYWEQYGFDASDCIDEIVYNLERQQDSTEIVTYLMDEYEMSMEDAQDAVAALSSTLETNGSRFDELQDKIEDSGGACKKMADTQLDNLNGSLTILKSALEGAALKMGNSLTPTIKELAEKITGLVDKFNNMSTESQQMAAKIVVVVAAVSPLLMVLGNLTSAFGSLLVNTGKTIVDLTKIGSVLNGTQPAISGFGKGLAALGSAATGPVMGAVAAVSLLAIGIVEMNQAEKEHADYLAGIITETSELTELQETLKTKTDAMTDSWSGFREAGASAAAEADFMAQRSSELWEELQGIVDENGKVKEGYEERAAVVTGLLSEAIGQEITLTDGVIQEYGKLCESIDQVIEKKKLDAYLTAYADEYSEAVHRQREAQGLSLATSKEVEKEKEALSAAEEDLTEKTQTYMDLIENEYQGWDLEGQVKYVNSVREAQKAMEDAMATVEGHKQKITELEATEQEATQAYGEMTTTITNYEGMLAASASNSQQAISDAMLKMQNDFVSTENADRESLIRQVNDYEEKYLEMKAKVESGSKEITEKQVAEAKRMVELSRDELKKMPENTKTSLKDTKDTSEEEWKRIRELNHKNAQEMVQKMKEETDKTKDNTKQGLDTTFNYLKKDAAKEAEDSGKLLGSKLNIGIRTSADEEEPETEQKIRLANFNSIKPSIDAADGYGRDFGHNLAVGIRESIPEVEDAAEDLANAMAAPVHHSVPKVGPLKDELQWMPDFVKNLAEGIRKNSWMVTDAMQSMAAGMSLGDRTANITLVTPVNLNGREIANVVNQQIGVAL